MRLDIAALYAIMGHAHRFSRSVARVADSARFRGGLEDVAWLYRRAGQLEEAALRAAEMLERRGYDCGPVPLFLARSAAWLYCFGEDGRERVIVKEYGTRAFFHETYDSI